MLNESLKEINHQESVQRDAKWVYSEILNSTLEPQTRVTAIETRCEESKKQTEELAQRTVNLVEPRIVTDLIQSSAQQAGDEMSYKQDQQMDEVAESVCERIADIIIGQSVQSISSTERRTETDQEEELAKLDKIPTAKSKPEETSIKNPLMEYMTQYAADEVQKQIV